MSRSVISTLFGRAVTTLDSPALAAAHRELDALHAETRQLHLQLAAALSRCHTAEQSRDNALVARDAAEERAVVAEARLQPLARDVRELIGERRSEFRDVHGVAKDCERLARAAEAL